MFLKHNPVQGWPTACEPNFISENIYILMIRFDVELGVNKFDTVNLELYINHLNGSKFYFPR